MARKTLAPWIYFSALCVPDLDRLPGHEVFQVVWALVSIYAWLQPPERV